MNKSNYLIIAILIFCSQAKSQNNGFTSLPDFPGLGRDDASAFVIGDRAYVGIGYMQGFVLGNDFYYFDSNTNSWHEVAEFPAEPRMYSTSFSLNGLGYILGGIGANNTIYDDVWEYNPTTNTWIEHPTALPGIKRRGMQTAVWNNNAYLFFGADTLIHFKQVWKFNGSSWTQLPDFPATARFQSADVQLDNIIYFVCGYDLNILIPEVWQFNLQTETWTQLADFPGVARWYARGFHFNNKIYIGTGWSNNGYLNGFWSYDPTTQIWEIAPPLFDEYRKGMISFNIGERAFIGMGTKITGERNNKCWEFVANAGINESALSTFKIFPNPTSDQLTIDIPCTETMENTEFEIIDITGKVIQKGRITGAQTDVKLELQKSGVYTLTVHSQGKFFSQKFCVQKN